jgi:hypothetical protein
MSTQNEHPAKHPQGFAREIRRVQRISALAALGAAIFASLLFASSAFAAPEEFKFGENQIETEPNGVAVSRQSGDVYVVATANHRVVEFSAAGAFIRAFGWGVATGAAELQTCTASCQGGIEGSGSGQFAFPAAIAVDNDPSSPSYGDLYVTDHNNRRVEKFDSEGHFLLMFGKAVNKTAVEEARPEAEQNLCPAPGHPADACGAGANGTGAGQFDWAQAPAPIASGPAGVLYVGDRAGRVQQFEPSGTFANQISLAPGIATAALAVDEACSLHEPPLTGAACASFDPSFGDLYVHQSNKYGGLAGEEPGVQEYSPGGSFIRTLDAAGAPELLALDQAGRLIAAENTSDGYAFREYAPGGEPYAIFTAPLAQPVPQGPEPKVVAKGIAVGDAASELYAGIHREFNNPDTGTVRENYLAAIPLPQPGPPLLKEPSVADLEPTTATLHATLNPEGFDTHYRFQYVTEQHFQAEGFANPESTPSAGAGLFIEDQPIPAGISGLAPSTRYRWRLLAESHCNEEEPAEVCETSLEGQPFETLPPVSVRDFTTQTVAPELVELKAELNPNNGVGTEWEVCYGPAEGDYSGGCVHGTLPVGNQFQPVSATFTGLQPNTTYHYQLIAHNSYPGEVKTPDQTFTTEPSAAEERVAEDCPENGTVHGEARSILREQNNSLALPDCRAYEQVSPVEKSGYSVNPTSWLAPSGDRSLFFSGGIFAGATVNTVQNEYVARRTAGGWVAQPAEANPAGEGFENTRTVFDLNAELDRWLFPVKPGVSISEASTANRGRVYLGTAGGEYLLASPELSRVEGSHGQDEWFVPVGGAQDYSTYFIATGAKLLPSDPAPEDNGGNGTPDRVYRVSDVYGEPKLELFGEVPTSLVGKGCFIDQNVGRTAPWASADGSIAYYTAPLAVEPALGCGSGGPNKVALFVRVGEAPPIQVSAVSPTECTAPSPCATEGTTAMLFYGASADGTRAWFATERPLVNADADVGEAPATRDLYMARLEHGEITELVQATHGEPSSDPTPGAGAGTATLLDLSADGTRAYFVATGVLTTEPNGGGESASRGAENVYAYDGETNKTSFVARLCTGPAESGSAVDQACPNGLGTGSSPESRNDNQLIAPSDVFTHKQVQATPDGRYLLFTSYAQLVPGDTDATSDVYRYDLQTGRLTRISIGRNGNDGNGNDDTFPATILAHGTLGAGNGQNLYEAAGDGIRAITGDGSQVVFSTAAPLVSRDTNAGPRPSCGTPFGGLQETGTGCDVYEWEEQGHGTCAEPGGCVSLISSGLDPHGTQLRPVISSSGRDISFYTPRGLVPADTDGLGDIYDARENGGFHYTPPKIPCGGGEICLGPAPPPPPPPKISTENEIPNPPVHIHCPKGKHREKRHGQIRCVPNKPHKKHHHKKHKRANTNRRGSK